MRVLLSLFLCVALSACTSYKWRDQTYSNKQDAVNAVKKSQDDMLATIKPLPKPVAKNARFVGVTMPVMVEKGTYGTNMDARDWIAQAAYIQVRATYDALVKRNVFEKLEYVEGDGSEQKISRDEAVLYFYVPDVKTAGWYFISPSVSKTPVHFDKGDPDFAARTRYFVTSVESLAAIKK